MIKNKREPFYKKNNILGLIVLLSAAAVIVWCFVRFNVKKRFTKDKKGSKYKSPVDLKVCKFETLVAI